MNNIKAIIFDAYGTLFDVNSAAEKCKKKIEKYGQKCDFGGSNRRPPGPNQTPRAVL